jgi:hypothetical protein
MVADYLTVYESAPRRWRTLIPFRSSDPAGDHPLRPMTERHGT